MPAKAGIQPSFELTGIFSAWIPAFAGMTDFAPPQALLHADIKELLEWSINNWSPAQLPRLRMIEQTDI